MRNKIVRRLQGLKKLRKMLKVFHDCNRNVWTIESSGKRVIRNSYSLNSRLAKKYLNTRVPCSCNMCGNPRRHSKERLTIQEQKALLKEKAENEDV